MIVPRFAVVGHPNKGKSSIVATLAQNDSIYIDRLSGSTETSTAYPLSIDGTVLYELIDTPGFQRARAALAWLEQRCNDASKRSEAIRNFCAAHKDDTKFKNEVELLQPLIEGAGIIYVVDGSRPYGPEYEAEMEILRWTGCPSMALINPIQNQDYVNEWNAALAQFFRTVHVFNAHTLDFDKHIRLLATFGSLVEAWQPSVDRAINFLQLQRKRQCQLAAECIVDLLVECLQYFASTRIPDGMPSVGVEDKLSKKYRHTLQEKEHASRQTVEQLFSHYHLEKTESLLQFDEDDLFDQSRWYLLGLSKRQLISTAAGAGASAGALIDLGVGGSSLLLGSLSGGLIAGASAWHYSEKIAKIQFKGLPTGGNEFSYGPCKHPNFPFVLLARAMHHFKQVSTRSHAIRKTLALTDNSPFETLQGRQKIQLMRAFQQIQKAPDSGKHRQLLVDFILNHT